MENSKILALLLEYVNNALDESDKNRLEEVRKAVREGRSADRVLSLDSLGEAIGLIERDIVLTEYAKTHGLSAKKRLEKFQKILGNEEYEDCRLPWHDTMSDEKYLFGVTRYCAIALRGEFQIPTAEKPGFDPARLKGFFENFNGTGESVKVDPADVRAKLKVHKTETAAKYPAKKARYIRCDYQIGNQYFDAEYLLTVCEILGGTVYIENNVLPRAGAVLQSENGLAFLCPRRKPEGEQ